MNNQREKERQRSERLVEYISKVIAWTAAIVQSQCQPVSYHTQNF